MKNLKEKGIFALASFILFVFILSSGCIEPKQNENQNAITVSVFELSINPSAYDGKEIETEGTLNFVQKGIGYFHGDFFIEEGISKIQVNAWRPFEVMACRPEVKCSRPEIMGDFLGKKIRVNGILKEIPKEEYKNNEWITTGTYYELQIKDANILQ